MKYSTIFKLFVVIVLLIVIGFVIQKARSLRPDLPQYDFGYPTIIDIPPVTLYDTLMVYIPVHDTVVITKVEIVYIEGDSLAVIEYEPENEYLSGIIKIRYSYNNKLFEIENNLIVKERTIIKEINKPFVVPPKLFRLSVMGGYYKGETGGAISIGIGVTLVDRLGLYLSALSNEMIGCNVIYNFD